MYITIRPEPGFSPEDVQPHTAKRNNSAAATHKRATQRSKKDRFRMVFAVVFTLHTHHQKTHQVKCKGRNRQQRCKTQVQSHGYLPLLSVKEATLQKHVPGANHTSIAASSSDTPSETGILPRHPSQRHKPKNPGNCSISTSKGWTIRTLEASAR